MTNCDICGKGLGKVNTEAPIYCIECIEEAGRLGMGLRSFKRHKSR